MSAFSDYVENAILAWIKGTAMPAAPAAIYVALFSSDPTDAATGTEVTTSINGGARPAIALGVISDDAGGGKKASNSALVDYGASTSVGNISVTHFGIFDAAAAGNLLMHGALTAAKTITQGDEVKFNIGNLTLIVE